MTQSFFVTHLCLCLSLSFVSLLFGSSSFVLKVFAFPLLLVVSIKFFPFYTLTLLFDLIWLNSFCFDVSSLGILCFLKARDFVPKEIETKLSINKWKSPIPLWIWFPIIIFVYLFYGFECLSFTLQHDLCCWFQC